MMKGVGILILSLLIGSAQPFSNSDFSHMGSTIMKTRSRKLKEDSYGHSFGMKSNKRNVGLEDYGPVDPVPSSKASLHPGPIQHRTPLIPYIPRPVGSPLAQKPSPPGHPKHGGSP